ncbi:MAG: hypothetical protein Q9207_006365, partial [Kuettlingeria erythrocarpa]
LYKTEKVYEMRYDPPNGLPRTNMKVEKQGPIFIEDIRGCQGEFSFLQNGFEIMDFVGDFKPEDFDDRGFVLGEYLPKVAHKVKSILGAARVQIVDTREIFESLLENDITHASIKYVK